MVTYDIRFRCSNCGSILNVKLPKGIKAEGNGGTCSYCECRDGDPKLFEVVPVSEFHVLLERKK